MASESSQQPDDSQFEAPWFTRRSSSDVTLPAPPRHAVPPQPLNLETSITIAGPTSRKLSRNPRRLPPELWARICEHMTTDEDHQPGLYALTLVCRVTSRVAQEYLYRYPYITSNTQAAIFLRSLALSSSINTARATAADPAALLSGRSVKTNATFIKGLHRTDQNAAFVRNVVRHVQTIQLFPEGFWLDLESHDIGAIIACRTSIATCLLGYTNRDILMWLAKIFDDADSPLLLQLDPRWPKPLPHALERFESRCDDIMLREAIAGMLPSDRKLTSILLNLPNLREMVICDAAITAVPDTVIRVAAYSLPNLTSVTLDCGGALEPRITERAVVDVWTRCKSLTQLTLVNIVIRSIRQITLANRLKRLRLDDCVFGVEEPAANDFEAAASSGVAVLIKNAPALQVLELKMCTHDQPETPFLESIISLLPSTLVGLLLDLDSSGLIPTFGLGDGPIPWQRNLRLAKAMNQNKHLKNLRELYLSGLESTELSGFQALLKSVPNLRSLAIISRTFSTFFASDDHFEAMSRALPRLTHLTYEVVTRSGLTSQATVHLANLPHLAHVKMDEGMWNLMGLRTLPTGRSNENEQRLSHVHKCRAHDHRDETFFNWNTARL